MFVTGPTQTGKSWLLHSELEKFQNTSSLKPSVFHFQMDKSSSFEVFLGKFERMLKANICHYSKTLWFNSFEEFLETLQKVLYRFYDP